jgi:uncharacterized repeat protein (TIGR02543 family)
MNVVDNYDSANQIQQTISGSVNISTVGNYTLTYSARDSSGNTSTPVTRQVIVETNSVDASNTATYTITYTLNSGTNPSNAASSFNSTQLPLTLPTPTRVGFNFQGWYESSSFTGNPVSHIPSNTTSNKAYFARWFTITPNNIDYKINTISSGYHHSGFITSDYRVFTWGWNKVGQLGDGTLVNKNSPIEITSKFKNGENVISLSLGVNHSSALTSSGKVFTWGSNDFGQLGDGTLINRILPNEITNNFNLIAGDKIIGLNSENNQSSALSLSGRVFTWGRNEFNQIGDGSSANKNLPTEITSNFNLSSDDKIISIELGNMHSAALSLKGRIFTWGQNGNGQLGNGGTLNRLTPYLNSNGL